MKNFLLIICFFICTLAHASHNRAGEIVYRHISGFTYEITIITYTKLSSSADSPVLDVSWGDNTVQSVGRTQAVAIPEVDAQRNIYKATHTYVGPGTYTISFSDRFRNADVLNMNQSDQVAFYTECKLVINPFISSPVGGNNNSVQLLYPPLDEACINEIYTHNPLAFDPDGDSLVYSLIPSRGLGGSTIPSYVLPNEVNGGPDNILTIDSQTGDMIWDRPKAIGEYNVAIKIEEYRDGILMGHVVRDMQINVRRCANRAPQFINLNDTCIEAGTTLNLTVKATDPNNNNIAITALGYPLSLADNPASFVQTSENPASGDLTWTTNCNDVRKQRHQILFRADDQVLNERLIALETYNITVIAPAPENPSATPFNRQMNLSWEKSICTNAIGYKVYRRIDSIGFTPDVCITGVPDFTGYQLYDTIANISDTNYIDTRVNFGAKYCYIVTACFADGAESYASEEFCNVRGLLDVPVITQVSVGETDSLAGVDSLSWLAPTQIDTQITFPGPYQYRIYESANQRTLIHTTASSPDLSSLPTNYLHTNINTVDTNRSYEVAIVSDGFEIGVSDSASSVHLQTFPTDNQAILTWQVTTPWVNDTFVVFRENGAGNFVEIARTTETTYTDINRINLTTYCYRVVSQGKYATVFTETLRNFSNISCVTPIDNVIPCTITLAVSGDCEGEQNTLSWDNANLACATTDDVLAYRIYFSPTNQNLPQQELTTISGGANISFTHIQEDNIAGCYAVTAIDSVGNESLLSNVVCIDNCPEYELPNVFTPNNDGVNDTFIPIENKFIETIEFTVLNRWGDVVFRTEDKNIGWDGTHKDTGEQVADGVYQYVVIVNKKTVSGIVKEKLNGFITIKSGEVSGE